MIDWAASLQLYGTTPAKLRRRRVATICDTCGATGSRQMQASTELVNGQLPWVCKSCEVSKTNKVRWQDQEFRDKVVTGLKTNETISTTVKQRWQANPEIYAAMPAKIGAQSLIRWQDPEFRRQISEAAHARWQDPAYQAAFGQKLPHQPWVSSIQDTLYSILNDLGVQYYREYNDRPHDTECSIGPYNFDCVIPRAGKTTLLIECQGDYWHKLPNKVRGDASKATYIAKHFPDQYELKQIWEHEFYNHQKVVDLLKYWLGITKLELMYFLFDDIDIRACPADDYRPLLSKYHYLSTAGRGGIAWGAYDGQQPIAVCIFSPLPRQNVALPVGCTNRAQSCELSRLCLDPRYQRRNFASWFISRAIDKLDAQYKYIIAYADTTYNHTGAVYKACNFKLDRTVPADYWYRSADGWVMHKKSLYNRAVKMGLIEAEFATQYGYTKVMGGIKHRFVFTR